MCLRLILVIILILTIRCTHNRSFCYVRPIGKSTGWWKLQIFLCFRDNCLGSASCFISVARVEFQNAVLKYFPFIFISFYDCFPMSGGIFEVRFKISEHIFSSFATLNIDVVYYHRLTSFYILYV